MAKFAVNGGRIIASIQQVFGAEPEISHSNRGWFFAGEVPEEVRAFGTLPPLSTLPDPKWDDTF
jgi:hypothetical protein